jgi:MtfA peptidase
MEYILLLAIFIALIIFIYKPKRSKWKKPLKEFPASWRIIILQHIPFFRALNEEDKRHFEFKVHEFLTNIRITGIKTDITESDKLFVAASAIIPIFSFKAWQYLNLSEVLVYPDSFNDNFQFENENGNILGMVGSGYMEGKMILSKKALQIGFQNENDKKNTAIHEFVHLIDKADGKVDGIPAMLLEKQYVLPWFDLIKQKTEDIFKGNSDINPYATTNNAEFFAVISEYFFERPNLLKQKHPELYKALVIFFNQDMSIRKMKWKNTNKEIGRNDNCPCGSGLKFKKCCGNVQS